MGTTRADFEEKGNVRETTFRHTKKLDTVLDSKTMKYKKSLFEVCNIDFATNKSSAIW